MVLASYGGITHSKVQKNVAMMRRAGDFVEKSEVEKLLKDKPDELKSTLEKAPRMTHEYTGAVMLWMPTYHMAITNEDTEVEERKRKLESEQRVNIQC